MKSKRANEFFADERVAFRTGGTYYVVEVDARKAVELAEEDVRERAIKTFCKLQHLDCEVYCTPCTGAECFGRNEFLKYYDNEN